MKVKALCAILAGTIMLGNAAHCSDYAPAAQTDGQTGVVVVKGETDTSYAGKTITLLLVDKAASADNITAADIGYLTQSKIGSDGSYRFRFKCDNANNYMLIANVGGTDAAYSITEAKAFGDRYLTDAAVALTKYNLKATVNVENVFASDEDVRFAPIFAFYNGRNLISVERGQITSVGTNTTSRSFECDVPEGTTNAKAFIWKADNYNIPLCKAKGVDAEFYERYIHTRAMQTQNGDSAALENTFKRLSRDKELNVAFFGGSVTSGVGSTNEEIYSWRAKTMKWFDENYPEADIKYCNAAIGGTGTRLGAYRIYHDVLDKMSPDLIFLMHSINDASIEENTEEGRNLIKIQLETEIQNILEKNPKADIVILYDIDRTMARALHTADVENPEEEHEFYWTSAINEELAQYYNITSINVGKALTAQIGDDIENDEIWSRYFNIEGQGLSVHPTDEGYGEYFKVINEFLEEQKHMAKNVLTENIEAKIVPQPLTTLLSKPTCLSGDDLTQGLVSCEWKKEITNPGYADFETNESTKYNLSYPIRYVATAPNQAVTYEFTGKEFAVRMFGANIEYSVDGGSFTAVSNSSLPLVCAEELTEGKHTVTIRTTQNYDYSTQITSFDCIMIR